MTEFALAPANATVRLIADVAAMLEAGELHAYRVRGNGTMRHVSLYPVGSTLRETAEWISDRIDMDGASVQAVAREIHSSTATVRRYIEGLELTEEIEAGEWNGIWTAYGETSEALTEASDQPVDQVEEILDQLAGMGKPADQVLEELEATKAAQAVPRPARRTRTPKLTDGELVARNQARFTRKPVEDAEVPGSQCEPVGTTADELEATLADSAKRLAEVTENLRKVDAPEPERTARAALRLPQEAGLAVCFCGDQGAHAPGSNGCKHVAIPRRARSHG